MRAIVLGSAAGGAFPQWNCGCPNCVAVREGQPGYVERTQDALAVTADPTSHRYVLVNASPDVLTQIKRTPALWPRAPRHSPIAAIVLTNGDMDHVLGLFSLRESWPIALFVTRSVRRGLEESAFIRTLRRFEGQLVVHELALGATTALVDARGESLGLDVRAFAAPGKLPVHFVGHATPSDDDNVGLVFSEGPGKPSLAYATACAKLDPATRVNLEGHAAVLFDGTFHREDELVRLGLSKAVAKDMAHLPIFGARDAGADDAGSLAFLRGLSGRRIYTHVNNTNPLLAPDSEARRDVLAAGVEIAIDGQEIDL